MKRLLLVLALLAALAPISTKAETRGDVSLDFFYNNLGNDGSWVDLGSYGYAWQPAVAVTNRNWRPYSDGYWAYTDVGWTWVSYEDFGWATYHYGRWTRVRDRGWFWIPGREWGPAWVSWRTGGDAVGWAPLPPREGDEDVYEGRPVSGAVDIDYDIGPEYYNFVDVRYIGEPVLRDRLYDVSQNFGYMTSTVNVTNITYRDSQICDFGPDYGTLSAYSTRPIQRLTLQRDMSADLRTAAQSNALTRVQGDKLLVAAPQRIAKPVAALAPKAVKEKIAKPAFDRGWTKNRDPKAEQELKEKIKAQDPKNIPPTTIAPRSGAAVAAPNSPEAKAAPGDNPQRSERGAKPENAAVASSPPASSVDQKHAGQVDRQNAENIGNANGAAKGKGSQGQTENAPGTASPQARPSPERKVGRGKNDQTQRGHLHVPGSASARPASGSDASARRSKHQAEPASAPQSESRGNRQREPSMPSQMRSGGKHERGPAFASQSGPRVGQNMERAPRGGQPAAPAKGPSGGGKKKKDEKGPPGH